MTLFDDALRAVESCDPRLLESAARRAWDASRALGVAGRHGDSVLVQIVATELDVARVGGSARPDARHRIEDACRRFGTGSPAPRRPASGVRRRVSCDDDPQLDALLERLFRAS